MMLLGVAGLILAYFGTILAAGPAGVLVMQAGLDAAPRRGVWIGLGSAFAQAPYAGVACYGASRLVSAQGTFARIAHGIAGAMLLGVAGWVLQKARTARPPAAGAAGPPGRAFLLGFAATITNPTPLLTWSMAAATLAAAGVAGGERVPTAAWFGACTVVGAAGAHSTIAHTAARLRRTGGEAMAQRLSWGVAAMLTVMALVAIKQAVSG